MAAANAATNKPVMDSHNQAQSGLECDKVAAPRKALQTDATHIQAASAAQAAASKCSGLRSSTSVRALCALIVMDGAPSPPCTAARQALATQFDKPEEAERPRSPHCKAVACEDQRTPLAQWPSESDGSEWLVSAEARLEAPAASFWDTVGTAGSGAASLMALASSGSVQWIINDWDSYDEAWESAYAYGASDEEEEAAERESGADSCRGGYCEEGVQPRAQVESPGGAPAKPREVLLPWDM